MKNLYKNREINYTEKEQSEIFDLLVCNNDTKEEGNVGLCTLKTNDCFGDEGNLEVEKINTPDDVDEKTVNMEKVIGTVCELSTMKAGSLLYEQDPSLKM